MKEIDNQDALIVSKSEFEDLKEKLEDFIELFEIVFHNDWHFTKHNIDTIEGTFLLPECPNNDEYNNWGNRGSLLNKYRKLKAIVRYF